MARNISATATLKNPRATATLACDLEDRPSAAERLLAALVFALAGLAAALVAWAALGSDDHPIVVRAVVSAPFAGAVVGLACIGPLLRRSGARSLVLIGAIAGVAFHPVVWTVFVVWSWTAAWIAGLPPGNLGEALLDVAVWCVPSIPFGAVLTVPAMIGAVYVSRRVVSPRPPRPGPSPSGTS